MPKTETKKAQNRKKAAPSMRHKKTTVDRELKRLERLRKQEKSKKKK